MITGHRSCDRRRYSVSCPRSAEKGAPDLILNCRERACATVINDQAVIADVQHATAADRKRSELLRRFQRNCAAVDCQAVAASTAVESPSFDAGMTDRDRVDVD